ncbi:uncharacterized protein [Eleutherodactylus coqui]|uniref:uncharacterized protein isoform X2 n=1 Tax=Eleutherodactylus coqui TaxID=57060 RepID=UPI0034632DEB
MDWQLLLALGLVVSCGVEGCSVPQSLSLSLSLFTGRRAQTSLQCLLCLDKKASSRRNFTFSLSRNGKLVQFRQTASRKISYLLENKNSSGLWRCSVQEFPELRAEYYLGPPTPAPPATKTNYTDTSVAVSTISTRALLTIVTAALLLAALITAISFTLGICVMRKCRRTPAAPHRYHKDRKRSDNFPLTEDVRSDLSNPTPDTEVSYVELEIIRQPSRKPSRSYNTIYANIM